METGELERYIEAAKGEGASDRFLMELFRSRGWREDQIFQAFQAHYERRTGLAIPARPSAAGRAREAFLYLLSFSTLAVWATALASLFFTIIEAAFPDALVLTGARVERNEVSGQLAAMIVAFPIYVFTFRWLSSETREDASKLDSPVRKWLTYIALLLAAGFIIGDLITFLSYFLRGELTIRFVLKVLTVLAIAAAVFWHYIASLRPNAGSSPGTLFLSGASVAVAIALIAGFLKLGSPSSQRTIEADLRRAEDLRAISIQIHQVWVQEHRLPRQLAELKANGARVADPVTGAPYLYSLMDASHYDICAAFQSAGSQVSGSVRPNPFSGHRAGTQCFARDAALPVF